VFEKLYGAAWQQASASVWGQRSSPPPGQRSSGAKAESIRRLRILATHFTEAAGQLTPSLKVRRDVMARDFAADIEALCQPPGPSPPTAHPLAC
jgi:hypothetical protein